MLVLRRHLDQSVVLEIPDEFSGGEVRVCLTDIDVVKGNVRAHIGFDAPKEIGIVREEIRGTARVAR